MEIQFVGPLGKVTGSCAWMRDPVRGWNFLVDCGMQQGERGALDWNSCREWPFDPAELQFVALTHAHIDHCGLIPALYKHGFQGSVYCTKETARLAEVLLRDAARFPGTPYEEADVQLVKWLTPGRTTTLGGHHPVADDLFIRFFRSGHIIGATSITIAWGRKGSDQRRIIFSGDVGPGSEDHEVLPVLRYPQHPEPGDFAVLESTYGSTVRGEHEKCPSRRRQQLKDLLDRILETKGTLAIPSFVVGRTQDLMFDLHRVVAEDPEKYGSVEFYLDSPSALTVSQITLDALRETQTIKHTGKVRPLWLGKQLFRELDLDDKNPEHVACALAICEMTFQVQPSTSSVLCVGNEVARRWRPIFRPLGNRDVLIRQESPMPRVVLMSSGTCDGGAAAHWLPKLTLSERNIIALSGYCAPATVGGQLLEIMHVPFDQRQLCCGEMVWREMDGETIQSVPLSTVKAQIRRLEGYSAHGDQSDLVNWLFENHRGNLKQAIGQTVFLQHGANPQRRALEDALAQRAADWGLDIDFITPDDPTACYDLERPGKTLHQDARRVELEDQIRRLQRALASLAPASKTPPGSQIYPAG